MDVEEGSDGIVIGKDSEIDPIHSNPLLHHPPQRNLTPFSPPHPQNAKKNPKNLRSQRKDKKNHFIRNHSPDISPPLQTISAAAVPPPVDDV